METRTKSFSMAKRLTESAAMIALATVLSLLKLVDLPYGGSVTAASMVPILLIAFRYGPSWGLLTGFVHGTIQLLLGTSVFSWVTGWKAVVAVILLDYVIAFGLLGLGGLFRKAVRRQGTALLLGGLLGCLLRYLCHVLSGATVWAGLSVPTGAALEYSLIYNATYMVPETITTLVVLYYLSLNLDFTAPDLIRRTAPSPSRRSSRSTGRWSPS